jgi:hypothetical protein
VNVGAGAAEGDVVWDRVVDVVDCPRLEVKRAKNSSARSVGKAGISTMGRRWGLLRWRWGDTVSQTLVAAQP